MLAHAAWSRAPLVPEIALLCATEVTPLWHATEAWLAERDVPPPFWAFAWAGGQALARFVLDAPEVVRGKRVLDVGAGGGLVAIAAALAGARAVTAVDVDPLAHASCALAAETNGVAAVVEPRLADATSLAEDGDDAHDVVTAGDLFYDAKLAAALLPWLAARRPRARVFVGDPSRAYAPTAGFVVRATFEVPVPAELEGATIRGARVLELV